MGDKTGLDDFLGQGHTVEEVLQLATADLRPPAADEADAGRAPSQATRLLKLVAGLSLDLFHSPDGRGFTTFAVGTHRENWPIRSSTFSTWLRRTFYLQEHAALSGQALSDALSVLEAEATFQGPELQVYVRTAGHDGKLYLDLCDAEWQAVEINATGWRIIAAPPVCFLRARGMQALPRPVPGGSMMELRRFVNVVSDGEFLLVLAWLLSTLRPHGPYPVLSIIGEQGSAKSTGQRVLRSLVDPNSAALRASPREPRDLMITARNSWVVALDNLSGIPEWLSDALCRLATGGGFATRELYTDAEEVIFDAMRPVSLNGIESIVERADLLDRVVMVSFGSIAAASRRTEAEFWREFAEMAPHVLGALLEAVSRAIATVNTVRLPFLPRMADFAVWAYAGLGDHGPAFIEAYTANRADATTSSLDSEPVFEPMRVLAEQAWAHASDWQGTASELLTALASRIDEKVTKQRDWPANGRVLSNRLRRLAPALRAAGLDVLFSRVGKRRNRLIVLARADLAGNPASTSSAIWPWDSRAAGSADANAIAEDPSHSRSERLWPPFQTQADATDVGDDGLVLLSHPTVPMLPGEDWEEFHR